MPYIVIKPPQEGCNYNSRLGVLTSINGIDSAHLWVGGAYYGPNTYGDGQPLLPFTALSNAGVSWSPKVFPYDNTSINYKNDESPIWKFAVLGANDIYGFPGLFNYQLSLGVVPTANVVAHWDGTSWTLVGPSGDVSLSFRGGTYISSTNLYTLAYNQLTGKIPTRQYNGTHWVGNNITYTGNYIVPYDIHAFSSTNIWFCGAQVVGGTSHRRADKTSGGIQLDAVGGTMKKFLPLSTTDIWCVGNTQGSDGIGPGNLSVLYSCNGSAWTLISAPPSIGSATRFESIDGVSGKIWCVGGYISSTGVLKPYVCKYIGTTWTRITALDSIAPDNTYIFNIRYFNDNDIWIVGMTCLPDTSIATIPLSSRMYIAHWNGSIWANIPI